MTDTKTDPSAASSPSAIEAETEWFQREIAPLLDEIARKLAEAEIPIYVAVALGAKAGFSDPDGQFRGWTGQYFPEHTPDAFHLMAAVLESSQVEGTHLLNSSTPCGGSA